MAYERIICCCGASMWIEVIAWFEIVGSSMLLICMGVDPEDVAHLYYSEADINAANDLKWKIMIYVCVIYLILGQVMGIILLMGTIQIRVGCIKARLIYQGVIIAAFSLDFLSLFFIDKLADPYNIFSHIMAIAYSVFIFVVVYIHMKEIKKGVFGLRPITV